MFIVDICGVAFFFLLLGAPLLATVPDSSLLAYRAEVLRKNLRQKLPLPLLFKSVSESDNGALRFGKMCLKNLGRTGKQPTMIPTAISAILRLRERGSTQETPCYIPPHSYHINIILISSGASGETLQLDTVDQA